MERNLCIGKRLHGISKEQKHKEIRNKIENNTQFTNTGMLHRTPKNTLYELFVKDKGQSMRTTDSTFKLLQYQLINYFGVKEGQDVLKTPVAISRCI